MKKSKTKKSIFESLLILLGFESVFWRKDSVCTLRDKRKTAKSFGMEIKEIGHWSLVKEHNANKVRLKIILIGQINNEEKNITKK